MGFASYKPIFVTWHPLIILLAGLPSALRKGKESEDTSRSGRGRSPLHPHLWVYFLLMHFTLANCHNIGRFCWN